MCIFSYIHKLLNVAHEVALRFLHCCEIICANAFLIPRVTSLNIITKHTTKLKNSTRHKRKYYRLLNPKIGRKKRNRRKDRKTRCMARLTDWWWVVRGYPETRRRMGLGGGWVDGWVQESDGLMEGWMDTFVLEWMSGGGTNGWVCVYLVGRGGEQTAAGWMEGWPTPAWKRLGGPCSLRQGLLLAQPAAGQPADHTVPGVHVCVCGDRV